jgi:hypothetical protein
MQIRLFTGGIVGLTFGACALMTAPAIADTVSYKANLEGSQEVPATTSKGSGAAWSESLVK